MNRSRSVVRRVRAVDPRVAWAVSGAALVTGFVLAATDVPGLREVGAVLMVLGFVGFGYFHSVVFRRSANRRSARDWVTYRWWNRDRGE